MSEYARIDPYEISDERLTEPTGWDSFESLYPDKVDYTNDREKQEGLNRHFSQSRKLALQAGGGEWISPDEIQVLAESVQRGKSARTELENPQLPAAKKRKLMQIVAQARTARNTMVESQLPFANYCARRSMNYPPSKAEIATFGSKGYSTFIDRTTLAHPNAELADRVQAASIGLIIAAEKYVPTLSDKSGNLVGYRTFAAFDIDRQLAMQTILNENTGINIPLNDYFPMVKALRKNTADDSEEDEFLRILTDSRVRISLDDIKTGRYDEDGELLHFSELLENVSVPSTDDDVDMIDYITRLRRLLDSLPPRDADILRMRFGLGGEPERNLTKVGEVLELSANRIRQIESKVMARIRHPSRSNEFREFIGSDPLLLEGNPIGATLVPFVRGIGNLATSGMIDQPWDYYAYTDIIDSDTENHDTPAEKTSVAHWQLEADEPWETPVRNSGKVDPESIDTTAEVVKKITDQIIVSVADFEQDDSGPMYPVALAKKLVAKYELTLPILENVWNTCLVNLKNRRIESSRIGLFYTHLLREVLTEDDVTTVIVPEYLGRMDLFGAAITRGHIIVDGNLGKSAGLGMRGTARLTVKGNVGAYAFRQAEGSSIGYVEGNAGPKLAFMASGQSSITVKGTSTSVEADPSSDVSIEIT
jgi:RNA polymerase sigma factor (sigma-70 family)